MLKKILIGIAAIVALICVIAAFQPKEYRVEREVSINAAPDVIFPYVNDTQKMNSWNPFVKMDPAIKLSYDGPAAGVGAASNWEGEKVGSGRSVVTESIPNSAVRMDIEFFKPFAGKQLGGFTLKPQGSQTTVSWSASGENSFVGRIICIFVSMDKMMGDTFQKGLGDLKSMVEAKK